MRIIHSVTSIVYKPRTFGALHLYVLSRHIIPSLYYNLWLECFTSTWTQDLANYITFRICFFVKKIWSIVVTFCFRVSIAFWNILLDCHLCFYWALVLLSGKTFAMLLDFLCAEALAVCYLGAPHIYSSHYILHKLYDVICFIMIPMLTPLVLYRWGALWSQDVHKKSWKQL